MSSAYVVNYAGIDPKDSSPGIVVISDVDINVISLKFITEKKKFCIFSCPG